MPVKIRQLYEQGNIVAFTLTLSICIGDGSILFNNKGKQLEEEIWPTDSYSQQLSFLNGEIREATRLH